MAIVKRLLFLSVALCLLLSCGTAKRSVSYTKSQSELVEYIWNFKDSHPDGFTLYLPMLTEPTRGISVAYESSYSGNYTKEDLAAIVSHAMAHDGYVGGWLDSRDSSYCFDSSKLFPESDLSAAIEFAKENKQAAVYVLSTSEEIWVNADSPEGK